MAESGDDGFAARWSRRKREAGVADEPVLQADRDTAEVAALTPADGDLAEPAQQDPPPDLPEIDSLTSDSDFSQFMQDGVPEELRRLALRKLWRLMPIIPDGLDDYDEDYSMIGIVAQKVSTLFKPGHGMQDPEEEEEAESRESADMGDADEAGTAEATESGENETAEATESGENETAAKNTDGETGSDQDGQADESETIDDETNDAEIDDAEIDDADGEIA